jgi:hypothetical protein|tara:strand:- start:1488 stop:2138 length:651 start_codon:yes stop_codon:yes gene_type:complete
MRRVNILGNGPGAALFQKGTKGELVVCNMPPIELSKEEVYASCMVDFKMMSALEEGQVNLGEYDWVLGTRPRRWMELKPAFYLKYSQNIRGFHTYVPPYAQLPGNKLSDAATNYSCGHMAVDYACRIMKATEVHMYGFDAMFDMNLESHTDNFLKSDRSALNVHRMASNWRPIWSGFFREFSNTTFVIHHSHSDIKLKLPENATVEVGELDVREDS